jgi:hypothetical protein
MFDETGFLNHFFAPLSLSRDSKGANVLGFCRLFIASPSLLLRSSFALPSLQGWDKNTGIGGIMVE